MLQNKGQRESNRVKQSSKKIKIFESPSYSIFNNFLERIRIMIFHAFYILDFPYNNIVSCLITMSSVYYLILEKLRITP